MMGIDDILFMIINGKGIDVRIIKGINKIISASKIRKTIPIRKN